MPLALYDTYAAEKRSFAPGDPKRVTMYVCGPTVYNYAHIGNARPAVVFDVLFRLLRYEYGPSQVVYGRNITDIDDKIIAAARETGEPITAITDKYAEIYRADMAALGVLPPSVEPHATGHIDEMIALVDCLLANGGAYSAEGHVLFDVTRFDGYGRLSKISSDDMIAGARVEVAPYKKNPADFVLWKPSAEGEPGWETPAAWGLDGPGRPGWHLECSAMIAANLGETIDIHGGGHDLRFPHHENEIAQSCCAHNGAPLARYWMHNGFLRMGADKMAKSLGNVKLVHDLLKDWPGEALRWTLLSAHYRQPLEWTDEAVAQSKRSLDRLYRALLDAPDAPAAGVAPPASVVDPLMDDLNTPEAFAGLFRLRDELSSASETDRPAAKARLLAAGALMGFLQQDPEAWFKSGGDEIDAAEVDRLLAARAEARAAKDYAAADRIRDDLNAMGVVIEDGPEGATWRLER